MIARLELLLPLIFGCAFAVCALFFVGAMVVLIPAAPLSVALFLVPLLFVASVSFLLLAIMLFAQWRAA